MTYSDNDPKREPAKRSEAFRKRSSMRTGEKRGHDLEDFLDLLSRSRENVRATQVGRWEEMRIESLRCGR